ncbi:hypothetical protein HY605_06110 [Candidatus Peregrinibacteria bacterium]|nr:hypothetical protein [Candidatus Peregrinibacteria bacterium]
MGIKTDTVTLTSLDICREEIVFAGRTVGKVKTDITVTAVPDSEQPAPDRYSLLRSGPIIVTNKSFSVRADSDITGKFDEQEGELVQVNNELPPIPNIEGYTVLYGVPWGFIKMSNPEQPAPLLKSNAPDGTLRRKSGDSDDNQQAPPLGIDKIFPMGVFIRNNQTYSFPIIEEKMFTVGKDETIYISYFKEVKEGQPPQNITFTIQNVENPNLSGDFTAKLNDSKSIYVLGTKTLFEYRAIIAPSSLDVLMSSATKTYCVYDYIEKEDNGTTSSNMNDSRAFIQAVNVYGFVSRGLWAGEDAKTTIKVGEKIIPYIYINLLLNTDGYPCTPAVKSAGAQKLKIFVSGEAGSLIINRESQADIFYYSGHGRHDDKVFIIPLGGYPRTTDFKKNKYWNKGLDLAIIAGCSLLDIGNKNQKRNRLGVVYQNTNPGKDMAASGAKYLVGYNAGAPADNYLGNNPNFTADIVKRYFAKVVLNNAGNFVNTLDAGLNPTIIKNWIDANIELEGDLLDARGIPIFGLTAFEPIFNATPYNCCGIDTTYDNGKDANGKENPKGMYLYVDQEESNKRETIILGASPAPQW